MMKLNEKKMAKTTGNFHKINHLSNALKAGAALGLLLTATGAMADDDPLSMAPPVDSNYSQGTEQVAAVNHPTAYSTGQRSRKISRFLSHALFSTKAGISSTTLSARRSSSRSLIRISM